MFSAETCRALEVLRLSDSRAREMHSDGKTPPWILGSLEEVLLCLQSAE